MYLSSLAKGLLIASQVKSNHIGNQAIFSINELRNAVIRKEVPENPNVNPNKIIGIAEKLLNFNNQQKGKRLKILTFKQVLQRLPIAPAQVKASNTSENVINEIRQIIYSLYLAEEITKKVYNNIMNSIHSIHNIKL